MLVLIEAIDFRNFSCFSIEPSAKFNLIFGANGAGKSSLLEAIYFLSLARSFRTSFNASIISNEKDAATIFGSIKDKNNLIVIEWADKVLEILPSQTLRIEIEHVDDTTRRINF